jgi:hypothetical protein
MSRVGIGPYSFGIAAAPSRISRNPIAATEQSYGVFGLLEYELRSELE